MSPESFVVLLLVFAAEYVAMVYIYDYTSIFVYC